MSREEMIEEGVVALVDPEQLTKQSIEYEEPSQSVGVREIDVESVSVSHGKFHILGNLRLQAHTAGVTSQNEVEIILNHLMKDYKFMQAKSKVVAYRISAPLAHAPSSTTVIEGYDDDGEEGAGEKLLFLLRKLAFENILIIVCLSHPSIPGTYGTAIYKHIIEQARDLLKTIVEKSFQNYKNTTKREDSKIIESDPDKPKMIGYESTASLGNPLLKVDKKIVKSQVFQLRGLPEQRQVKYSINHNEHRQMRIKSRRNNFMNEKPLQRPQEMELHMDITEEEFLEAYEKAEECLESISKAHILQLKSYIRPHPLIEKVLIMLCILKGNTAATWSIAKDLLNPLTLKLELSLIDINMLKHRDILRVHSIMCRSPNLNPQYIARISVGASLLLSWMNNILIIYIGNKIFKEDHSRTQIKGEEEKGEESLKVTQRVLDHKYQTSETPPRMATIEQRVPSFHPVDPKSKKGYYVKSKNVLFDTEFMSPALSVTSQYRTVEAGSTSQISPSNIKDSRENLVGFSKLGDEERKILHEKTLEDILMLAEENKNNTEILKYLDSIMLENQSTDSLIEIAKRLRNIERLSHT